jgi:subtilisin family serine protease
MNILKNTLLSAASAIALMAAAPAEAAPRSYYDYALAIKNTAQQTQFMQSMINNYTRTITIYKTLVDKYGHYSWAASIVQQYNWHVAEAARYQDYLNAQADTPTVVGTEVAWSSEFTISQRGAETLASETVREVEEATDTIVNVYSELTRVFETPVTDRQYRGRVTYTLYSNGDRVPLVNPLLLNTTDRTETRTDVTREFVRSYAKEIPVAEVTDTGSDYGTPTANVLTVEEYTAREDVNYANTDTYRDAVWTANASVNIDYINTKMTAYGHTLEAVGAPEAWSRGWTGAGSVIAILDSGIDTDHTEFAGRIDAMECFTGRCELGYETIEDLNGHGTHVAGLAAAALDGVGTTGVAPDAHLLIGKVAYDAGFVDLNATGDAIRWAVENGADVINLSASVNMDPTYKNSLVEIEPGVFRSTDTRGTYATEGFMSMLRYLGTDSYNSMNNMVDAFQDNDSVLVIAAGNNAAKVAGFPSHLAVLENADGSLMMDGRVIIAGNYDLRTGAIASSSNRAGTVCFDYNESQNTCNTDRRVSDFYLMAPGQWSASTWNNGEYRVSSGTSMAAPVISGGVALVHQMWPHMTGENLVSLMLDTANKDIPNYNVNIHGQGIMDLAEATRPQGDIGLAIGGRIDGYHNSIATAGTMSIAGTNIAAISSLMVVDEYDRDFYVDGNTMNMSRTPVVNSYAALAGVNIAAENAVLSVSDAGDFGVEARVDGVAFGVVSEAQTFLGNYADGAIVDVDGATTVYAGFNFENTQGATTWFGGVNVGVTTLDVNSNAMMKSASTLVSNAARVGFSQQVGAGKFSVSASLPVAITSGSATFDMPTAVSLAGDIENTEMSSSLANTARQVDIGFSYDVAIADGFTVGTFANFNDNYQSIAGAENATVGVNIGWTF